MNHDKQTSERTFYPNDPVLINNYHCGPAWLPGEVLSGGPRNYKIKLSNGVVVHHHVDQMQNDKHILQTLLMPIMTSKIFNHPSRTVARLKVQVPRTHLLSLHQHFKDLHTIDNLLTDTP